MHCPLGYRRRWPWSLLFDIFQADKTHCRLERQVQDWSEWLDMHRLRLNIKKTEYMECRPLNKVTDFKYLGSLIRSVSDSLSDAHAQVTTAQMAASYGDCLWLPNAPTTQDLQNCLYAQSRWAVLSTDKHEQTLHGMEMKILRCSLSLTQLGGVMNEDVQRRMGMAPVVKMRKARPRWFEHVISSGDDTVVKTVDCLVEDMNAVNIAPYDALDWDNGERHANKWTLCQHGIHSRVKKSPPIRKL